MFLGHSFFFRTTRKNYSLECSYRYCSVLYCTLSGILQNPENLILFCAGTVQYQVLLLLRYCVGCTPVQYSIVLYNAQEPVDALQQEEL
jgi:hypothetical protein